MSEQQKPTTESTLPPHVIHATTNGQLREWKYDSIDEALLVWNNLIEHRVIPGTSEAVTGLVLHIASKQSVSIPDEGWAPPRAKEDAAA